MKKYTFTDTRSGQPITIMAPNYQAANAQMYTILSWSHQDYTEGHIKLVGVSKPEDCASRTMRGIYGFCITFFSIVVLASCSSRSDNHAAHTSTATDSVRAFRARMLITDSLGTIVGASSITDVVKVRPGYRMGDTVVLDNSRIYVLREQVTTGGPNQ